MEPKKNIFLKTALADLAKDIKFYRSLLDDGKRLASGEYTRAEILADIAEMEEERTRLLQLS